MPIRSKPITDYELKARQVERDFGAELCDFLREANDGKNRVVYSPVVAARQTPACRKPISPDY